MACSSTPKQHSHFRRHPSKRDSWQTTTILLIRDSSIVSKTYSGCFAVCFISHAERFFVTEPADFLSSDDVRPWPKPRLIPIDYCTMSVQHSFHMAQRLHKDLFVLFLIASMNYPHSIIILAFMLKNALLLQSRKVTFDSALTHRQSLRHLFAGDCRRFIYEIKDFLLTLSEFRL